THSAGLLAGDDLLPGDCVHRGLLPCRQVPAWEPDVHELYSVVDSRVVGDESDERRRWSAVDPEDRGDVLRCSAADRVGLPETATRCGAVGAVCSVDRVPNSDDPKV